MSKTGPGKDRPLKSRTKLVHAGRDPFAQHGFINTPIYRGSTVLAPTYKSLFDHSLHFTYGTKGTPTTEALETAWTELAGAAGTVLAPSGLAAITLAVMAAVKAGDYKGAYRAWGCTTDKACSGYPYEKFMGDWSATKGAPQANPDGPPDLSILGMTDSESCRNGVLLTVAVNPSRTEKLWVDKSSDAINYAPYPICPHKNPWAIMLHRTVGKLRKPFLR